MFRAVITELFKLVDAAEWDSLSRVFHDDVVYERPGYQPCRGIAQLIHFYRHERVIAFGTHHLERIVVDQDHAACWGKFIGAKKDGSPINERFADVYAMQDSKIRERRSYFFRPAI
jgi:ketosteroid isomerase-like protein